MHTLDTLLAPYTTAGSYALIRATRMRGEDNNDRTFHARRMAWISRMRGKRLGF